LTIIFLNGCTSAGKSSIAKSLQEQIDLPYLVTGIDVAFAMIPTRFHNHPEGFEFGRNEHGHVYLSIGDVGRKALDAHQLAASAIAKSGFHMILDEVVLDAQLRNGWKKHLAGLDVFSVGVHCELLILEQREKARGDRVIGQALGQFGLVHQDMDYDMEVDTSDISPAQAASRILKARANW